MRRFFLGLALLCSMMCVAYADPQLSVIDNGMVGANRQWLVQVAPDPSLFIGGAGSLSLELGFEVTTGELASAAFPAANWLEIGGLNPFSGAVTDGLLVDLDDDTVFLSIGEEFNSGDFVEALVIETVGSGNTTLSWGGHSLRVGTASEYVGSRIAQAGMNFDEYQGSLSVGTGIAGDYDGSGVVAAGDLNLVLNNWGQDGTTPPIGWVNDFPDGVISAGELNGVLNAWGNSAVVAVPEPSTFILLGLSALLLGRHRR